MDVRFLIDEHIDHAIAAALRQRGHDVLTLVDANLLGADDLQRILPFATAEGRVVVTRDADFLALHREGASHAGIVHRHGKKRNIKQAIRYLLQLVREETAESMVGVVRYIKINFPREARVRHAGKLPRGHALPPAGNKPSAHLILFDAVSSSPES